MWTVKQEKKHSIPSLGRCRLSSSQRLVAALDMETSHHRNQLFDSYEFHSNFARPRCTIPPATPIIFSSYSAL